MRYSYLFLFYVAFYTLGRLGLLAGGYPFALLLDSVGFHLNAFLVVSYLILGLKDTVTVKGLLIGIPVTLVIPCLVYAKFGYRSATTSSCLIAYSFLFLSMLRVNWIIAYKSIPEKVIWGLYLVYAGVAMGFYIYCQYNSYISYSYEDMVTKWGVTLVKSAALRNGTLVANLQNLFIPAAIFCTALGVSLLVERNLTRIISKLTDWVARCQALL